MAKPNIRIRAQNRETDLAAIGTVNDRAFAEHGGTLAFDKFREERDDILSLVATLNDEIIGHILFSPVYLATASGKEAGTGLGQLAVDPDWQGQGIGAELAETGIRMLREQACPFIIVIGHATYYPRFGFVRGSLHGIRSQWENVPDESFMVLFLDEDRQAKLRGVASFDGM